MHSKSSEGQGKFLSALPLEIQEVLDWYGAECPLERSTTKIRKFARRFLSALVQDQAIIPVVQTDPPKLLAMVLLHHQEKPENAVAWLNLGFALRRMALYRIQDSDELKNHRLQSALKSFQRSLELESQNTSKNIRAWVGQALVYHQLSRFDDQVKCCLRALELDRSDPNLWLFYSFALKAAGNEEEALRVIDNAYQAYLMAGQPEELRHLFVGVVPQGAVPDPHPDLEKIM